MKASSLRVRVTAWYVSLLAIALVVFSVAVYVGVGNFLLSSLKRGLRSTSRNISTLYLANWDAKGADWALNEIQEANPGGHDRFIRIWSNGTRVYRSANLSDPFIAVDSIRLNAPPREGFQIGTASNGIAFLILRSTVTTPAGKQLVLECGGSLATMHRDLRSLLLVLLGTTPIILVIAAIGGFLLIRGPLRPIQELTEQAERVGRKELGERLPVIETGDELERLAIALNEMIGRLEEAVAHNRRFSADASHELRTPLTIIRGELEQIIDLFPQLPPVVVESAGSALEEIERMSRIVNSLMTISRLDAGGESMERSEVDLTELTLTTVEQMQFLADEEHIELTAKTSGPVMVTGDRTRLKQVLVNLLDNAMKYTPGGGRVIAWVYTRDASAVIEVEDSGIGIPQDAIPFVFDRFYRADKARSRESGGIGLGLSIVKAICAAHEGSVTVSSVEGQGTTFRVELPCTRPACQATASPA